MNITPSRITVAARHVAVFVFIGHALGCSDQGPGGSGHELLTSHSLSAGSTLDIAAASPSAIASAAAESVRVKSYLESFYPSTKIMHSFATKFGENIDCVDWYSIPSVKAALARGWTPPAAIPPSAAAATSVALPFDGSPDTNGRSRACPAGSAPMMRPTADKIQKVGGNLAGFLARGAAVRFPQETSQLDCFQCNVPGIGYDHVAAYNNGFAVSGLFTHTPVYTPFVQSAFDHTLSQMWLMSGTCEWEQDTGNNNTCTNGNAVQSLEMGWIMGSNGYPSTGFDATSPILFTFITQNGYNPNASGGNCWGGAGTTTSSYFCCPPNTDCFVPAQGAQYVPGMQLASGTPGGAVVEVALGAQNFTNLSGNPNWVLYVNYSPIGFFPDNTYTNDMQTQADYQQVGGEVYDSRPNGQHTQTGMGSGYGAFGYGTDAYHRNIQYFPIGAQGLPDWPMKFVDQVSDGTGRGNLEGVCGCDASDFYGLLSEAPGPQNNGQWGSHFFFGGPVFPDD